MTRPRAYTVLAVLMLANLAGYAARNELFAVYDDLRATFAIDRATIGLLTTAFLVPHAIATLPLGWAGDRFDRRRVIAVGLIIAAVAAVAGAFATNVASLVLSRVAVGLGTAAVVPVANSIISQLFDPSVRASRMSVFNLGVLLGGVSGFGVGAGVGYPAVLFVLAVPCLVLGLGVLRLPIPPHPARTTSASLVAPSFSVFARSLGRAARTLLAIRTLRWVIVSTTAMAFASGGYVAWLIDFLKSNKHMSEAAATSLLSASGAGAVAGILTGARIADYLRARTANGRLWTIAFAMVASVPCAVLCIVLPAGTALYASGIAMMFFFSWYHAPMAVTVDDLAPPAHVAAAQGLVIFVMHLVGTAPASYVVGLISDRTSLYTAMWVPTGALVLAALAMVAAIPGFTRDHRAARGEVGAL
jgi:predicted MFS family arabinose efflux permease